MLIFKHIFEKSWCEFLQVWAVLFQKDEALELHMRSFEARNLSLMRGYTNPIYPTSYLLVATIWTLSTDANYRVKMPAPDSTHTITNTESTQPVGITSMGPFVYQRIQRLFHANRLYPKLNTR